MKKIKLLLILSAFLLTACGNIDSVSLKVKSKFLSDYAGYQHLKVLCVDTTKKGNYYLTDLIWTYYNNEGKYLNRYISYYSANELCIEYLYVK